MTAKNGTEKKAAAVLLTVLYTVMILAVYGSWISANIFVDEQDVFYGGYNVVMSGDVYACYPSQHMPVSYYLAAVGALAGARTISQFRVFFYVLMTGLWVMIYLRNRRRLNQPALFMIPLIYLFSLKLYPNACTMVSDHWQGIGLIIILTELMRFGRERSIFPAMAAMVSLGVVLSFGSAFLSVYPIFIIFLGVVWIRIRDSRKPKADLKQTRREDIRLVLACLAPFALLTGWYAASGNLKYFFDGVYTLNVDIYARYTDSFNNNAAQGFLQVIPEWLSHTGNTIAEIGEDPRKGMMILLQAGGLAGFGILYRKQDLSVTVTVILAALMAGVRGFSGFHAAPYIAACAVPTAWCAGEAAEAFLRKKKSVYAIAPTAMAGMVLFLAIPTVTELPVLTTVPARVQETGIPEGNEELLDILTDPGDRIHVGGISGTSSAVMAYGLRLDEATPACSNPWFYEMYGKRELAALKENKTRVVVMDPDAQLWGYRTRDYAADLVNYLEAHYIKLEEYYYIHEDAAEEMRERLRDAGYGLTMTDLSLGGTMPWDVQEAGEEDAQYFIAAGSRLTACWLEMEADVQRNPVGLTVSVEDPDGGEIIAETYLTPEKMERWGWVRIALEAELKTGKAYRIGIRTDSGVGEPRIRLFRTMEDTAQEDTYAVVNGDRMNYSYSMKFEYAAEELL